MNRGHRCLVLSTTVPVIFKTCCLHCLLKDNNKTKHMTGLIFDEQNYCQSYCIYKDPDIHRLHINHLHLGSDLCRAPDNFQVQRVITPYF